MNKDNLHTKGLGLPCYGMPTLLCPNIVCICDIMPPTCGGCKERDIKPPCGVLCEFNLIKEYKEGNLICNHSIICKR